MSGNSDHNAPGHIIPFSYTLGTFIALLFLTVITVGVAQFDLGALDMPVALLVAGVKALILCCRLSFLQLCTELLHLSTMQGPFLCKLLL